MSRTPDQIVAAEVIQNISSLVSTLANAAGGNDDSAEGTSLADLAHQAADLTAPVDDWIEPAVEAGWTGTPEGWVWREPKDGLSDGEREKADFYFLGFRPLRLRRKLAGSLLARRPGALSARRLRALDRHQMAC